MDVMMQGYVFVSVGAPAPHPDGRAGLTIGKSLARASHSAALARMRTCGGFVPSGTV